jgi:hypothetical protein
MFGILRAIEPLTSPAWYSAAERRRYDREEATLRLP